MEKHTSNYDMLFINTLTEGRRNYKCHKFIYNIDESDLFLCGSCGVNFIKSTELYHIEKESSYKSSSFNIMIENLDLCTQTLSTHIIKTVISAINLANSIYGSKYASFLIGELDKVIYNALENLDTWFINEESYINGFSNLEEIAKTGSLKASLYMSDPLIILSVLESKLSIDTETSNKILKNPKDTIDILTNLFYSNMNFINELAGDYMLSEDFCDGRY